MAYANAPDYLLKTAATQAGTFVLVKGVKSFAMSAGSDVSEEAVFGQAEPEVGRSKTARTFTGDGIRDTADTTGQNAIKAAYESGAVIYLQDLPNGLAGTTYPVLITDWNEGRTRSEKFLTFDFSGRQQGASVIVP